MQGLHSFGRGIRASRSTRPGDLVFLSGFAEELGVINSPPMIGCHAAVKASIPKALGSYTGHGGSAHIALDLHD